MLLLDTAIKLNEKAIKSANLTPHFPESDLQRIGNFVLDGYKADKQSRRRWETRMEAAMDLALQLQKDKTFPWQNASNVAFPLITIATLQFHSRAYPTLISSTDLVKMRVTGADPTSVETERALRIGRHMSYQLLEEDHAWEEQQDRLLINVPIVGSAFKKSYFDPVERHNISELVLAKDFVLDYFAKSVETARRKTHVIPKFRNEIYEKVKLEAYRDVLGESWYRADAKVQANYQNSDTRKGLTPPQGDQETPFTFLEQHCWMDLDQDGYAEPYIVAVEEQSGCVLRITTRFDREADIYRNGKGEIIRISPMEYFTKYGFIPSPDGGIYDLGFGILLGPLNESVNTLVNQLIDSGTMSSLGGGFLGRGAKIRGGSSSFAPMEWKRVDSTGDDLRKNIIPLVTKEPSPVLFNLLSLLINYTNRISGSTEMMAGENPGQNTPAGTADNMIEQGMKVYAAIFKRTWRSMKEEFKKLYTLNSIYLQAGTGGYASREDYLGDANKVCPAADPNVVSDAMRFNQATAVAVRAMTVPGYDAAAVEKNYLRSLKIENADAFYVGVEKTGQPKDVKLQIAEMNMELEKAKLAQKRDEFTIQMMEQHNLMEAQIEQLTSAAGKLQAQAQGVNVGHQIALINTIIAETNAKKSALHKKIELMLDVQRTENETRLVRGELAGMERPSSNKGTS